MKLPVIYADGTAGAVDSHNLDILLRTRSLLSFRRSDGWCRVYVDELRSPERENKYVGIERRQGLG